MVDNLCGPSNGAKNLVNHVNRDRSLQQDRMVNGAHGGSQSSFRSASANVRAADQSFAGFQQNGLTAAQIPLGTNIGPASLVGDIRSALPVGIPASSMAAGPHGFSAQHPQGPSWAGPAPGALASGGQDWVNQFSSMQLQGGSSHMTSSAVPRHQSPVPHFQTSNMNAAAHLGYAPPAFAGGMHSMYSHGPSPMLAPNVYGGQQQVVPAQKEESSLDVDAFNAAFGAYDDAEFNQELASWAEQKETSEAPRNEQTLQTPPLRAVAPDRIVEEVVQKEQTQEEVDANRRHREDEELARAAISILGSVSENDSEKFKKSNFFELMRRIGNREVVVEGTNLVDATTGETVVSKDAQDPVPGPGDDGKIIEPSV
ncbi:hypothetical protein B0T16DRAFT_461332 [Cercophora newfieldiana]|uniref:Peroxin 20 n=1 Tax=Cercophora newfieldiana TaxID=92897 RepID=A0AA39XXL5_9PEZI|nr:hypothetical protein B0T16DRAFT_461332 [Cercophora newfieldiana]